MIIFYFLPNRRLYVTGILFLLGVLFSRCRTSHELSIDSDESDSVIGVTILESVPRQEASRSDIGLSVPDEVVLSGTDAVDSAAASSRAIGSSQHLSSLATVDVPTVMASVVVSDMGPHQAATKIQSVARMYLSNRSQPVLATHVSPDLRVEEDPSARDLYSSRLSTLRSGLWGVSALALGSYMHKGHLSCADLLIAQSANVESRDQCDCTPLHEPVINVNSRDQRDRTPLHWAVISDHSDIAKLLLECGADVHSADDRKYTPLHCAAQEGHLSCVDLLIAQGANVESRDQWDRTPLHRAVIENHPCIVKSLLEYRANVHSEGDRKYTPLHWAAREGHLSCVELLIDKGANIESKDQWDRTALHSAAQEGRLLCVKLLIDKGAHIESRDNRYYTPLHRAAEKGYLSCVKLLINKGANLNARNDRNRTPLDEAAANNHSAVVIFCLRFHR